MSRIQLRRFTIIELIVVLSLMGILAAAVSRSLLKAKKNFQDKADSMQLSSGDLLDTEEGAEPETGKDVKAPADSEPQECREEKSAPPLRKRPGIVSTAPAAPRPAPRKRIRIRTAGDSACALNPVRKSAAEKPQEELLPPPQEITPGSVKVTVISGEDQEIEPFARYFFEQGTQGTTLKEYRKLWKHDVSSFLAGREQKLDGGVRVPLFTHYLRQKAIFQSSPYRTYLLRKKILLSYTSPFVPGSAPKRLAAEAEKVLVPYREGEMIEFMLDDQKISGIYKGTKGNECQIGDIFIVTEDLPDTMRWKVDKKALKARRQEYVEQQLQKLEASHVQKERQKVQKILDAEFPMLRDDPLLVPLREVETVKNGGRKRAVR